MDKTYNCFLYESIIMRVKIKECVIIKYIYEKRRLTKKNTCFSIK